MNMWIVLTLCSVALTLLLALVMCLLFMVQRMHKESTSLLSHLLAQQVLENQKLRNQLRAPDVNTLLGLNHALLPTEATASNQTSPEPIDLSDLQESINYEEQLAKQGYTVNDLDLNLEASGWNPSVVKRTEDGDPIAFTNG